MSGLKALGHQLPDNWTPDDELCDDVKREFGITDDDIRTELLSFHANHAQSGTFSANWRASFFIWCKRWKEHQDKQAPPRVEVSRGSDSEQQPTRNRPSWEPTEEQWDGCVKLYALTGRWSPQFGPDPMSRNCRAPRAILERYKVNLETGERRSPPRAPA
jgi:hypothetical protein